MLLVNFYLKALLDNISVYIMLSLKEKWLEEREREREGGGQLPAPTANKVGPCPIATVFVPDDFLCH